MLKNIIFLSLFLLVLSSCEDFFATTLEVDPPEHIPQMAVHAYFNTTDTTIYASVSKTVGLLDDPNDLAKLDDATVDVYSGDQKLWTLALRSDPEFKFYNYSLSLDEDLQSFGQSFELRVNHPDFPEAKATQTLPELVEPEQFKYLDNAGINEFGEATDGVEISFSDPVGVKNYYEIAVMYIDTFYGSNNLLQDYITSLDPLVTGGANYGTLLLSDETFDGKDYKLRVQFQQELGPDLVFVNWRSLSESQYLYSRSIRAFYDAQDAGPFGEPVSIYSNVENGLGIFGSASGDFYPLEE